MAALALLASIAAAAAAPAETPGKARLLNAQELVTPEDYPLVSLRNEEQGTVTVKVRLDASGLVTSCQVTKSSGHSALDEQTCALLRARARFEPARDRRGRAIRSDYVQKMTWKLADSAPMTMPRTPWTMRTIVGLDSTGAIVDCKVESVGTGAPAGDCYIPQASSNAGSPAGAPRTPDNYAISELIFHPADPGAAPEAPELEGAVLGSRQVSRLTISPDGQILACERLRTSGPGATGRDECQMLSNVRFNPAAEASGPTVGTLVQTHYVRDADGN